MSRLELATNPTFGGPDLRDLYLTAGSGVYNPHALNPGICLSANKPTGR